MLASIEMPANFVPLTNAVMSEMARRGVGRQEILTTLHNMGRELPEASVDMIKVRLIAYADIVSAAVAKDVVQSPLLCCSYMLLTLAICF